LGLLFVPLFSVLAYTYERIPPETYPETIENPVKFIIEEQDICLTGGWKIGAYLSESPGINASSECTTSSDLTWESNLPIGIYVLVEIVCWDNEICEGGFGGYGVEENIEGIFEVIPSFSILSFTSEYLTNITDFIGNLFTDIWVLVALVIGLPLAFAVIREIVLLAQKKKSKGIFAKYKKEKSGIFEKLYLIKPLDSKIDKEGPFEKEQKRYDKIQERLEKKDAKFFDKAVKGFGSGKKDWL